MSAPKPSHATARCACGSVELQAIGAPIASVACYCDDCQEGGRRIEALTNAPSVLDPQGGTEYALYRKDRVTCVKGSELLQGQKIRAASMTNRVVATCCNSAMVVNFDTNRRMAPHWIPVYRGRLQGNAPPLQLRIMTKFKPPGASVPADVPSYATFPLRFVAKLVAAQIAMLFRR